MSDMYAIKASTLTALGDAVRNKNGIIEEKFEGIQLGGINIQAPCEAPKYKYILNNASTNPAIPSGNKYTFIIYRNSISGEELYRTRITAELFDEIVLETDAPIIYITFNISTHVLTCDVTIIPLDENGNEYKYTPLEMAEKVNELNIIPESAFTFSGDCQYCFGDNWSWFINECGDKITTKDVTNCQNMFHNSQSIQQIPFDINIASTVSAFGNMFYNLGNLKTLPYIKGKLNPPTNSYSNNPSMQYFMYGLYNLIEIPDDYFDTFGGEEFWTAAKQYTGNRSCWFHDCYSIRRIPDLNKVMNKAVTYSGLYCSLCYGCRVLDEIINLPVCEAVMTSNSFLSTASNCNRLKTLTFTVNEDGTPKTVQWKSQTLDLTNNIGYAASLSYITGYSSGITSDKVVANDTDYQESKNDPDWFTTDMAYSRYNHDSAVATINSLPDTSAYLAEKGGTNTIKFRGASGALTDGGAINTLTEEEIATAAAKGWTVTLV